MRRHRSAECTSLATLDLADDGSMWLLIPLGGFALGAITGRWWALAAALPFGGYILATNNLESHVGTWVAVVLSILLGCAIAAGVALRRLQRRSRRAGQLRA
jgi:threonine/homoserine efflux transporter RhtA